MEEANVIIYYCYGLNFKAVPESKTQEEVDKIKAGEAGEAGKDGRKMRYITVLPKKDILCAIHQVMVNGL